jgi:hypothetical protein
MLEDFRQLAAEVWFNRNLATIGPHTREMREALIQEKMVELQKNEPVIKNSKEIWKEVMPRMFVTVVGEAYNTNETDLIMQTINLEQDPNRRAYFLDYIYKSKGIPTPPAVTDQAQPMQQGAQQIATQQQGAQQSNVSEQVVPA